MLIYAGSAAVIAVLTGAAHSAIGERAIFKALREEKETVLGPRIKAVLRAVWHMPSITWAALGIGVAVARLTGGDPLLSLIAAVIFIASGIGNMTALRKAHFGGLLLFTAAALTAADWLTHN